LSYKHQGAEYSIKELKKKEAFNTPHGTQFLIFSIFPLISASKPMKAAKNDFRD